MTFTNFTGTKEEDMLRTVIIDDEDHVRETLARLLAMHCPQVKVIGEASSVASGVKAIRMLNPQLVLLDIKMDDGTGFDLLRGCGKIDFKVIFITAFENYAIQAFRFAAIDFLLKPVDPEELADAVRRAETLVQEHFSSQLQAMQENMRTDLRQKKKIVLKTLENIYLVDLQDITYLESDGCYTLVHLHGEDPVLISRTLGDFEEMLGESGFYRVHKSFLINLMHIKRFEKQEGGFIILTDSLKVPVASRKREELMELFEKL